MLRCRKESISNAMNEFQWICFLNGYISFNDLFSASSSQPTDHKSRQPAPVAAPPFHMQSKLSCKRLDEIELADAQGRVLYFMTIIMQRPMQHWQATSFLPCICTHEEYRYGTSWGQPKNRKLSLIFLSDRIYRQGCNLINIRTSIFNNENNQQCKQYKNNVIYYSDRFLRKSFISILQEWPTGKFVRMFYVSSPCKRMNAMRTNSSGFSTGFQPVFSGVRVAPGLLSPYFHPYKNKRKLIYPSVVRRKWS